MEHPVATVPSKNAITVMDAASPVTDKRLSMTLTGGLRTLPGPSSGQTTTAAASQSTMRKSRAASTFVYLTAVYLFGIWNPLYFGSSVRPQRLDCLPSRQIRPAETLLQPTAAASASTHNVRIASTDRCSKSSLFCHLPIDMFRVIHRSTGAGARHVSDSQRSDYWRLGSCGGFDRRLGWSIELRVH
jgi:hypothetical protein